MTASLVTLGVHPHAAIHYLDADGVACGHTNHDGRAADPVTVAVLPDGSYGSWADTTAALTAAQVPACRLCRRCWRGVKGVAIPSHTRGCWHPTTTQKG